MSIFNKNRTITYTFYLKENKIFQNKISIKYKHTKIIKIFYILIYVSTY